MNAPLFKKIYLLLVIAISISPRAATATKTVPSTILFKRVSYICPSDYILVAGAEYLRDPDPQFTSKMKFFFESVVLRGLERLKAINPTLTARAVDALLTRDLVISCEPSPISLVASYDPPRLWAPGKISMGSAAWATAYVYDHFGPPKGDYVNFLEGKSDPSITFNLPVIFHEFLHFARFDNYPSEIHNHRGTYKVQAWKDLVYACAEVAYRSKDWFPTAAEHERAFQKCQHFRFNHRFSSEAGYSFFRWLRSRYPIEQR